MIIKNMFKYYNCNFLMFNLINFQKWIKKNLNKNFFLKI